MSSPFRDSSLNFLILPRKRKIWCLNWNRVDHFKSRNVFDWLNGMAWTSQDWEPLMLFRWSPHHGESVCIEPGAIGFLDDKEPDLVAFNNIHRMCNIPLELTSGSFVLYRSSPTLLPVVSRSLQLSSSWLPALAVSMNRLN